MVVTYRYTEPALGGAEEYLVETLKRLRPRFERIDLAAVDTQQITNRNHFGCDLTDGGGAAGRIGALFDRARYFPIEHPSENNQLALCRFLERTWLVEEFDLWRPSLRGSPTRRGRASSLASIPRKMSAAACDARPGRHLHCSCRAPRVCCN